MPEQASTYAPDVDYLMIFMVVVCGLVTVGIIACVIFFSLKYRRRSEDEIPPASHASPILEYAFIGLPLVVFMIMFVWGAKLYFDSAAVPPNALEVYVIGRQWMWKFQHPGGQREINYLHVPVGRPVKLTLASEDVIHSFFVPAFRIHADVLPRRYTTTWFEATTPGEYNLFCSQFCGTEHAGMGGKVIVMTQIDYERWLTAGAQDSLASKGKSLFYKLSCNSCHIGNSQARAPYLSGIYSKPIRLEKDQQVVADENYFRESILTPAARIAAGYQNIMPSFQGQLTEEQLVQLITFLKYLGTEQQQFPLLSTPLGPQPSPAGAGGDNINKSSAPVKNGASPQPSPSSPSPGPAGK
ncbi:MAG: cytochrome c oxidase subunit II [Pyrinomonadaceae bacterium]